MLLRKLTHLPLISFNLSSTCCNHHQHLPRHNIVFVKQHKSKDQTGKNGECLGHASFEMRWKENKQNRVSRQCLGCLQATRQCLANAVRSAETCSLCIVPQYDFKIRETSRASKFGCDGDSCEKWTSQAGFSAIKSFEKMIETCRTKETQKQNLCTHLEVLQC